MLEYADRWPRAALEATGLHLALIIITNLVTFTGRGSLLGSMSISHLQRKAKGSEDAASMYQLVA